MSYLSEDKIAGFCILSAALGVGSGVITFHLSHVEGLGWGVGIVVGVIGLLVMIFVAKIMAIIDDFFASGEPDYYEDDEDEEENQGWHT